MRFPGRIILYVPVILVLLITVSCAPKIIEKPSFRGVPLEEALAELKNISSIEAVLNVEYEKNNSVMGGDAFLHLSGNRLNLRLYYLGFLAGEVNEENGIIKCKPKIDRNKSLILVDGLKNSFFWWNIRDYTVSEKEDVYVLKNYNRKLFISKDSLLPVQQTIELDSGEEMNILYDTPAKNNAGSKSGGKDGIAEDGSSPESRNHALNPEAPVWYQSRLSIKFKNYLVRVKVKSYSVTKQ